MAGFAAGVVVAVENNFQILIITAMHVDGGDAQPVRTAHPTGKGWICAGSKPDE